MDLCLDLPALMRRHSTIQRGLLLGLLLLFLHITCWGNWQQLTGVSRQQSKQAGEKNEAAGQDATPAYALMKGTEAVLPLPPKHFPPRLAELFAFAVDVPVRIVRIISPVCSSISKNLFFLTTAIQINAP